MRNILITYTGIHFDMDHPTPEMISIEDIARSLSLMVRGNGHVQTFFSVAQHCLMCAKEAEARHESKRVILACLLHDASEAYMSDVPTPLKYTMPDYLSREEALQDMIYTKYLGSTLTADEEAIVDGIDSDCAWYDMSYLIEPLVEVLPDLKITPDYHFRDFRSVEDDYLAFFNEYMDTQDSPIVDLEDVTEEIEASTADWQTYLNIATGEYITLSLSDPSIADDGGKGETINAIDVINSDDYVALPGYDDIDEDEIMNDYISLQDDDDLKEDLENALGDEYPQYSFKKVLGINGMLGDFRKFRHQLIREIAREWLDNHQISYT